MPTPRPTELVRGQYRQADTFGNLENVLAGETGVHIDRSVVEAAVRRLLER